MLKQSILSGSLGQLGDRFVMECYKGQTNFIDKVRQLSKFEDIQGIELANIGEDSDAKMVSKLLEDAGLQCACVDLFIGNQRIYKSGSLSNSDPQIRSRAIDECRRAMDQAALCGADVINLWPGQDGHDYSFCTDYRRQYECFVESLISVADHNKDIKVAIEFKSSEPRQHSLVESASTALLMSLETKRENVGVCVDTEHVLFSNGNIAGTVELCDRYGKLFHVHVNDCYGKWYDGLMAGSVHFNEYLEFVYTLKKIGYSGWCSHDISPYREDAFEAAGESTSYIRIYENIIDSIGLEQIGALIDKNDPIMVSKLIRERVFQNYNH